MKNKTNRVYISKSTCEMIRKQLDFKELSYREVASFTDISPSTVCRICKGNVKYLSPHVAKRLSIILDVQIENMLDESEDLIQKIHKLEHENRLLKRLLIEKWGVEPKLEYEEKFGEVL